MTKRKRTDRPVELVCTRCGEKFSRRRGNDRVSKHYQGNYCQPCYVIVKKQILDAGRAKLLNRRLIKRRHRFLKAEAELDQLRAKPVHVAPQSSLVMILRAAAGGSDRQILLMLREFVARGELKKLRKGARLYYRLVGAARLVIEKVLDNPPAVC